MVRVKVRIRAKVRVSERVRINVRVRVRVRFSDRVKDKNVISPVRAAQYIALFPSRSSARSRL